MKKKFLAVAMAAVMAFSAVSVIPANTPVAEAADTTVINVDKTIGAEDLSSTFWTAFGDNYKIEDGKSYTINFDVYGGASNWNNCFMVLSNVAATSVEVNPDYKEFGVVRMDNWGWSVPSGGQTDNKTLSGDDMVFSNSLNEAMTDDDWAKFREIMTKATVAMNVKRDGKNITIEANVHAKEDASKSFVYKASVVAALEDGTATPDVYLTLGVDGSMIKPSVEEKVTTTDISEVVGAEDNSAAFWSAFSKQYKIESGKTYVFDFENHSNIAQFYNNYVMVFTNEAAYNGQGQSPDYFEYAVIRADNWGWSATGENIAHNGTEIVKGGNIAELFATPESFYEIVKDANVSLTINRKDDLVATEAIVTSISDPSKSYTYTATFSMDTKDGELYFGMTLEGAHLVMKTMSVKELSATMPENPQPGEVKPPNGTKKQIMLSAVSAKVGAKKVTGTVNAPDAAVSVQVNKKTAVKATVKDKKFTANLKDKLKAGDKVKITVKADGYYDKEQTVTVKGTMKINKVTAKKGAKKVTGTISQSKATVKVKVGSKAYKKAKVSGKKFTLKVAKLKKGTKVTVKATKKNYKTVTKSVKVK